MIITLAGQKGGSGKTTTSLCLADEWHVRGKRVLIIDTDPQATARTWADVANESDIEGPTVIGMGAGFHTKLEPLKQNFDVVVIDCPPSNGEIQRAALMVSDFALLPCGPGATDVWSIAETAEIARQAKAIRPSLNVGILITRRDARTALADQIKDALGAVGLPIMDSTLGFRVAYQAAPTVGVGVTRYEPNGAAADEVRSLVNEIECIIEVTT